MGWPSTKEVCLLAHSNFTNQLTIFAELTGYHCHPTLCALYSVPCPVQVWPARTGDSETGAPHIVTGKADHPNVDPTTRTAQSSLTTISEHVHESPALGGAAEALVLDQTEAAQ